LDCIEKREPINKGVINTNVVEWYFGDTRNIVGNTTNKLRAKPVITPDRKADALNRKKTQGSWEQ